MNELVDEMLTAERSRSYGRSSAPNTVLTTVIVLRLDSYNAACLF